jgi:hypothetical protein
LRFPDAADAPITFSGSRLTGKPMTEHESNLPVPSTDLDHYLADPFNQGLYEELQEIGLKPLEFFEIFYQLVSWVEQGKPSQVLELLDREKWDGGIRLFVLYTIFFALSG